jgi:ubiquinone/menaquinone biosynthesis C-methylase UbiE
LNKRLCGFFISVMEAFDDQFYQTVSTYYDQDVELGFKNRAAANPLLERIRNDFRAVTIQYPFEKALEIGCGPGFDVCWFAQKYPERQIGGVDISEKMVELAQEQIREMKLPNASVLQSDERALARNFPAASLDLIYVYFGALNTVTDLDFAASQINTLLKPGSHAVLTFVNKYYLREMLVQILKLNFKRAFARLKKEWGGYSPERRLPSRCYSPARIKKAFRDFALIQKKGYSIRFPAWYNPHKVKKNPRKADKLWLADQKLQNTFLWSKGEYLLFVFQKPPLA